VTIGAVLGMAAYLDGLGVGVIDMAGLAQKGGAVTTHMKIAPRPEDIHSIRVAAEEADTVLACDLVVAGSKKALAAIKPGQCKVFANLHETFPGDFTRHPDFSLPTRRLMRALEERAGAGRAHFIEAHALATALMGDAIAANMFTVGFAWQGGGLPISRTAILRAIELNGVDIPMNQAAFEWGRRAAHDPAAVQRAAGLAVAPTIPPAPAEVIERRAAFLQAYQDARYAARYRARLEGIAMAEERAASGETALTLAAARSLFKLMAIKDEYEVARLYTDGSFERQLKTEFETFERLEFHLAPPLLAGRDKRTGLPRKQIFGPWMMQAFRLLARLKVLRGTPADPFSYPAERRWERRLLSDYETILDTIEGKLAPGNYAAAVALASYPQAIRGFGHVKEAQARPALAERDKLLRIFAEAGPAPFAEAAE
jgi:indolepyruvate ferredoxin oxidoreductase